MSSVTMVDFSNNVSATLGILPQVISTVLLFVGLILFIKAIFGFKAAAEIDGGVNLSGGLFRVVGAMALIFMSYYASSNGETVLIVESIISSPGKVFAETVNGKDSSKKDEGLALVVSEVIEEPAPIYAKECLVEGGFATYRGGKVEILLDQGNGWYRVKNKYGESLSKQKSDMECM